MPPLRYTTPLRRANPCLVILQGVLALTFLIQGALGKDSYNNGYNEELVTTEFNQENTVIQTNDTLVETQLEQARVLWSHASMQLESGNDYNFEYISQLMADQDNSSLDKQSPVTYIVEVRNDTVSNVYRKDFGFTFPAGDNEVRKPKPSDFPTIPELFDMIEEDIVLSEANAEQGPVVRYNVEYGYPEEIVLLVSDQGDSMRASERNNSSIPQILQLSIPNLVPYSFLQKELEEKKDLWLSYDTMLDSYEYSIQVKCFCIPEFTTPKLVRVVNGTIVSTTDIESGLPEENFQYTTPLALFETVQFYIDQYYIQIDVVYDQTFGFPTQVSYNPEYNLADAGRTTTIFDFQLIN